MSLAILAFLTNTTNFTFGNNGCSALALNSDYQLLYKREVLEDPLFILFSQKGLKSSSVCHGNDNKVLLIVSVAPHATFLSPPPSLSHRFGCVTELKMSLKLLN